MTCSSFRVRQYLTQKLGANRGECEDAVAFNHANRAFAVADGATEAFDSRYWARLLARAWVRQPALTPQSLVDLAQTLGARADKRWSQRKLSWYAEEKARAGSYAALVGVVFFCDRDELSWQAIAVGDCCLLQLREQRVITTLPITSASEFGFRPTLLPSKGIQAMTQSDAIKQFTGGAQLGDSFLLLSDAVACWLLEQRGGGSMALAQTFESLLRDDRIDELDIFFDEQRTAVNIKNDDIAAIHIQVG
jgi:hypothetical protein